MGLDSVEFLIALEESFGVDVPDAAAVRMRTPRDVIDYLVARLPRSDVGVCLSQRSFYKLRAALPSQSDVPAAVVTPDTEFDAVMPRGGRAHTWEQIRNVLVAANFPGAPAEAGRLGRISWWKRRRPREVVRHVVAYAPRAIVGADEWTRAQITEVVTALCEEEFGVDMWRFTLDSSFRDMGVD